MPKSTETIAFAAELFGLDNQARRLTKATQHNYNYILTRFNDWCIEQNIVLLSDVTSNHIRQFMAGMVEAGHSSNYQHNYARALKTFFNFCVREQLLTKPPMANVQMPRLQQREPVVFSDRDIARVLAACPTQRDTAICLTLLDTGLRASELCALNIGDIDMKTGAVTVNQGKQQKDRTAVCGPKARLQLRKYWNERDELRPVDPAFCNVGSMERFTPNGLVQLMRRLQQLSGVKHCTAHTFRRTFATEALRGGMNIYALARLMGHADITVLRKYLALAESDLLAAHEDASPVKRMTKR